MRNLRRLSQGIFLALFVLLFLQTESKGADELGWPVKLFLDFDPLILLTTLLSAHAVEKAFYLSMSVIVLTVLLGRVFCGWACPLGTLNSIVGAFKRKRPGPTGENLYKVKYYVLVFMLASSAMSLQLAGIIDPISLLIRSMSVSVYPAFNFAVRSVFDVSYAMDLKGVTNATEALYSVLKDSVLAFRQPHFRQGVFIGLLFLAVMGLNLVRRRFWCKYLCPLGALLGLLSRHSLLRRSVSEGCNECGLCSGVCQGEACPDAIGNWKDTECCYCMNCDDICPNNAVSFGFSDRKKRGSLDLGRRRVLVSALSGAAAVPILRATPAAGAIPNPRLIRPPGALEEKEFLRRCVKCGECMKVCITNGLQPTLFEAGLEGVWSPVLVPTIGYCEYRCTLCGQVCPTGAIRRLGLVEKARTKIGLAMINQSRCLPWSHATPCIVCEEVCPTSIKAVWLEDATAYDRKGVEVRVKRPKVDLELCVGCGICETKCPVLGMPAIFVTSAGESRSASNRLLLRGQFQP
jgi:polyferredoxin